MTARAGMRAWRGALSPAMTPDAPIRSSFLARRKAVARRIASQLLRGPLAVALAAAGLAAPARAASTAVLDDDAGLAAARAAVDDVVVVVLDELARADDVDRDREAALDAALLCAVAAREAVAVAAAPAPRTDDLDHAVQALQTAVDATAA